MIIDLNKLYKDKVIELDEDIDLNKDTYPLGIKNITNTHLNGFIKYGAVNELELNLTLSGSLILEDAMTLEDISHNFSIQINEIFEENDEKIELYLNKEQNTLDIQEILWENIILEVPIRVRKDDSDVVLDGEGWQLNKNMEAEIDPRLAELNKLFDEGKE